MPYNRLNFFLKSFYLGLIKNMWEKYMYIDKIGFTSKHDDAFQYQKIKTCEILKN